MFNLGLVNTTSLMCLDTNEINQPVSKANRLSRDRNSSFCVAFFYIRFYNNVEYIVSHILCMNGIFAFMFSVALRWLVGSEVVISNYRLRVVGLGIGSQGFMFTIACLSS